MNPILQQAKRNGWSRRVFLRNLFLSAGSVSTASWLTGCGSGRSVQGGPFDQPNFNSPFKTMGALQAPDANGVSLPAGFSSRLIANFGQPPVAS
ncbi:MAG: hypothetical protein ACSHXK_13575, partial [Oceanococcus sp.]